jgi:hypothetical protein
MVFLTVLVLFLTEGAVTENVRWVVPVQAHG